LTSAEISAGAKDRARRKAICGDAAALQECEVVRRRGDFLGLAAGTKDPGDPWVGA
jgi:hypothetical protein